MKKSVVIGNAQAFWGDRTDAAAHMLAKNPAIDFITFDYLAEVSMSILAIQREKNPALGYAQDFIEVVKSVIPFWIKGSQVKLIANAGGLNPKACAEACNEVLRQFGCVKKIGIVTGDDVLDRLKADVKSPDFNHLESRQSLESIHSRIVTANAYLGAEPIIEALRKGAEIVITGRVADPSLTVAAAAYYYSWDLQDYAKIGGATIAGHVIECGTQSTGGIFTHWLELPNEAPIGFPLVEIEEDGSFTVTKCQGTGGRVSIEVVKEQLLYEIGDPANYLSPDATVSFLNLKLSDSGENRVFVCQGTGSSPPETLKVSATYRAGYKAEGFLGFVGCKAKLKAEKAAQVILNALKEKNMEPSDFYYECLGTGAIVPLIKEKDDFIEVILRVAASDPKKDVIEAFTKEIAPLVTGGPPGTSGYTSGRPQVRPMFGYWPCLIDRKLITPRVDILEVES